MGLVITLMICVAPLFVVMLLIAAWADADEYENPLPEPVSYGVRANDVICIDSANWTGTLRD